jgi:hypothetical protein
MLASPTKLFMTPDKSNVDNQYLRPSQSTIKNRVTRGINQSFNDLKYFAKVHYDQGAYQVKKRVLRYRFKIQSIVCFILALCFQVDSMYIEYFEEYYRDVELRFSVNTEKILALLFFFLSVVSILKHREEL